MTATPRPRPRHVPQRVPARQPEPLRVPEMPRFEPIYVTERNFLQRGWDSVSNWGRRTGENLRGAGRAVGEWAQENAVAIGTIVVAACVIVVCVLAKPKTAGASTMGTVRAAEAISNAFASLTPLVLRATGT